MCLRLKDKSVSIELTKSGGRFHETDFDSIKLILKLQIDILIYPLDKAV